MVGRGEGKRGGVSEIKRFHALTQAFVSPPDICVIGSETNYLNYPDKCLQYTIYKYCNVKM